MTTPPLKEDLLQGAKAIADFLGFPPRRIYALAEPGTGWPIFKQDGVGLMARKSTLTAHIEKQEKRAKAGAGA